MKLPLSIVSCTAPSASWLAAILFIALLVQILVVFKSPASRYWRVALAEALILISSLWLGSYRFSPFYSSTNILRGFEVTAGNRAKEYIQNADIITIGKDSTAVIVPILLPGDEFLCNWSSQNGGALDDPASCDTLYAPPVADYDILRFSVRSSCGLPDAVGQIKFSILP